MTSMVELDEIRNTTIEECARVADNVEWQMYGYKGRISAAIRALKKK